MTMREAMKTFAKLALPLVCEPHVVKAWSVDAGVRLISEQIGADLVIIANRHRHPLVRLFKGSHVEALVNHAEIPVLSVDFIDQNA